MLSGIILGAIIVLAFLKLFGKQSENEARKALLELENHFNKLSQEALMANNEQFLFLAKEKLEAQKQEIKNDLENKKSAISELMEKLTDKLSKSDDERIATFSALKKELENYKQITSELKGSTDDLKRLLSNNQLRGQFGEQVAENLLKMSGFVVGVDYVYNKEQEEADTRPDFTVFMPDKTKINIDVKFPFSALVKYTEADGKTEKEQHIRQFASDVRQKLKQVTTRDYINTDSKTVDFVILFIPNEMIFSFIYDKLNDIWEEAMTKKVIMAGPFSFTAILRMIKQAYSNFRYQKNLYQVIALIQKFDKEYQKYNEELDKLGERIASTSKQYDNVSGTRTRTLKKIVDQIKEEDISELSPESNPKLK